MSRVDKISITVTILVALAIACAVYMSKHKRNESDISPLSKQDFLESVKSENFNTLSAAQKRESVDALILGFARGTVDKYASLDSAQKKIFLEQFIAQAYLSESSRAKLAHSLEDSQIEKKLSFLDKDRRAVLVEFYSDLKKTIANRVEKSTNPHQ